MALWYKLGNFTILRPSYLISDIYASIIIFKTCLKLNVKFIDFKF